MKTKCKVCKGQVYLTRRDKRVCANCNRLEQKVLDKALGLLAGYTESNLPEGWLVLVYLKPAGSFVELVSPEESGLLGEPVDFSPEPGESILEAACDQAYLNSLREEQDASDT